MWVTLKVVTDTNKVDNFRLSTLIIKFNWVMYDFCCVEY